MSQTDPSMPGSITTYRPEMAAEVAAMFEAFNELWPGGFGGGVPYTEERVHDWLDATSAVADLIALDAEGTPVGYCGVYPHYRDRHACYVTILGVVPHVKGHKFGKRLLLRAVELAGERGFTRLDLHTWPGNMDAVPLYKKTGLFWVPETSVYMQNYLPGLARTPLAAAWFERHPNWYGSFARDLSQVPDSTTVDGMALYTYRFVAGEDELVCEIDRYGWGLSGIRSTLNGERLSVITRIGDHQLRMGLPNTLSLSIENGTDRNLQLALAVEPFPGMAWEAPFPATLTLPRSETTTLTRTFVVDKDATIYNRHEASEVIRSRIILDGQVLDLVTGGQIQPAVAVEVHSGYRTAHSGVASELHFDLTNHAHVPLTGRVSTFVAGVRDSAWEREFELDSHQIMGITAPLPAHELPAATAHINLAIDREGQTHAMPTTRLPIVSSLPERAVVVPLSSGHELHMVTDTLSLYANLKGGHVNLGRREIGENRRSAGFSIGPPFGISLDNNLTYTHRVEQEGDATTLVLEADSLQFPGLRLERAYRVRPNSREVEHWVTLTALSATAPAVGGRFTTGDSSGGLSLNPYAGASESYTPVGGRIVACDAQLGLMNDTVVPQSAAAWAETWTAQRTAPRGDLVAVIWDPAHVSKVRVSGGVLRELEMAPVTLAPGEAVRIAHVWFQMGTTSLVEVRHRWNQLVGRQQLGWQSNHIGLARGEMIRPVEASWVNPAPLVAGVAAELRLALDFAVPAQLPGELRLTVPEGWQGAFLTAQGPQEMIAMPVPEVASPAASKSEGTRVELAVALTAPAPGLPPGAGLALRYRGEYEISWELPLLVGTAAAIMVEHRLLAERPVIHVDNGALCFDVVADTGGQLIRLQAPGGVSFLEDVFPNCRAKFFVTDFVGGAQPLVFHRESHQIFNPPAPLTSAEIVTEGAWQGVRVGWIEQHDERLRGQAFALTYLVAPGVPVIRLRVTRATPTERRFEWEGGFLLVLDQQRAGTHVPLTFTVPGTAGLWAASHPWRRFPAPRGFAGPMDPRRPWAWAQMGTEESADKRTLGFLGLGPGTATPVGFDFGELAGAFLIGVQESGHGDVQSLEYALVVNRPREEAEALIAALSAIMGE
jgi:GNAT superfamily N-acetyltransferase